ncbi:MAG: hypothetical protein ACOY0R_12135 [Chloroflexota bacterium]|jgi:hypothetical protein
MNETNKQRPALSSWLRGMLLALALLTSPALCCGGAQLLDALPASPLDFGLNLFEGGARVENQTSQTVYVTAVTTASGAPRVIPQNAGFRQRDIPVAPQGAVTLQYDAADSPLAGIVVCLHAQDCRLLPANASGLYELGAYESLQPLDADWSDALRAAPSYQYGSLAMLALGCAPVFLFTAWLYWTWHEKKKAHPAKAVG